jgi:hypothetical protein
LSEFDKDTVKFSGFYRATILDNVDPSKLGRVKLNVLGVYTDIASADLPWAVPAFSTGFGSGSGYGNFSVPHIGSNVFVFFEAGDLYQPVYFASAPDGVHGLPTDRVTNYPDRNVIKTPSGIVVYIDDHDKVVKLVHPTGKYVQMDGLGSITIVAADVTIQASGKIDVTATGEITISGSKVYINP